MNLRAGSSLPMISARPASAPATMSLWPLRYFVAECITRSTPRSSGRWLIGLANVLSNTDTTPRSRHADAIRRMSRQRSVGLVGDSNQSTFVSGPMYAARSSLAGTRRTRTPNRSRNVVIN